MSETPPVRRRRSRASFGAFFGLFALIAASGCERGTVSSADPKGRLQDYITRTFNVKGAEDRQELLGFLSGDARTRLSAWSDDQFRQAFIDSKRKFLKLAFREVKTVSPTEVSITYELVYNDKIRETEAKVTNKKLAQMTLVDGKWLIGDVKNIKELVEYQNEMSLP